MIWPIDGLKIDYDTVKLQKVTKMTSFFEVIKIMSPEIRHQNDVTTFLHFQTPLLVKSCMVCSRSL